MEKRDAVLVKNETRAHLAAARNTLAIIASLIRQKSITDHDKKGIESHLDSLESDIGCFFEKSIGYCRENEQTLSMKQKFALSGFINKEDQISNLKTVRLLINIRLDQINAGVRVNYHTDPLEDCFKRLQNRLSIAESKWVKLF